MDDDCKSNVKVRYLSFHINHSIFELLVFFKVTTAGLTKIDICNATAHMPPVISEGQELSLHVSPGPGSTSATFRFEAMYSVFENGNQTI